MTINVENLLDKVSESVKSLATTETVLGDEFTLGDFTVRPVMKMGTGFGTGSGSGKDAKTNSDGQGAGAGAAIGVQPVGFLVAKGGEISFIPSDKKTGLSSIFEKVPDMMEKMMEMKEKKDAKDAEKEQKTEKRAEKK